MTSSVASSLQFDTDTAQQNIIQQAFWAAIEEGRKVYSMALFFTRLFIFTEGILRQEVFIDLQCDKVGVTAVCISSQSHSNV